MTDITVNGTVHHLDGGPETPLLWYLRDELGLLGTRFGCGAALCGCTVHVNDVATRSCTTRICDVEGKHITTIEGLSANGLDPLREACEGPKVKFLRPTLPAGGRERAGPFRNRHGSYPLLFAP